MQIVSRGRSATIPRIDFATQTVTIKAAIAFGVEILPPEIPRDRALTDDELEAAMIHALLNPGGYAPGLQGVNDMLAKLGKGATTGDIVRAAGGAEALELRFLAVLWRWVGVGLLVNRGPNFVLARGSKEFLEERAEEAEIVLRRSGLVNRLRERCPNLDSVTERYAAWAQESFLAGHYQAAAVMIGVASESALLYFEPRCRSALGKLNLTARRLKSDRAVDLLGWIDAMVTQHRKDLGRAVEGVGEVNWIGELPAFLGIATGIGLTRNEAGHPTPQSVSRDECRNLLALFPRVAEALFVSARAFEKISAS